MECKLTPRKRSAPGDLPTENSSLADMIAHVMERDQREKEIADMIDARNYLKMRDIGLRRCSFQEDILYGIAETEYDAPAYEDPGEQYPVSEPESSCEESCDLNTAAEIRR